MTFSRVNASTWRDHTGSISASQLGTFDDNQSKAVDAAGGGRYAPSSTVQINGAGFGSNAIKDTTLTGVLTRETSGRWVRRTTTTTIQNVGAGQVLDMSYDTYYTNIDHDNFISIWLSTTTGFTPAAGDTITVVREGIPTSGDQFVVYSEAAKGTPLAVYPDAAGNQSNEIYSGEFYYTGSAWIPYRLSCDIEPV
jgi:hypothetical protein